MIPEFLLLINAIKRNEKKTHYNYLHYDFSKIKIGRPAKLKVKDPMNPNDLIPTDIDLPIFGKKYDMKSNLSTILTQLARYAKSRPIRCDPAWNSIKTSLQEMFISRFLKRRPSRLTNGDLEKHVNPVVKKLFDNGGAYKDLNLLLGDKKQNFEIHFFLKNIVKCVSAKTINADKAGQGISAWPKALNSIYCVLFRAIEKKFVEDLKENIIYDNGISETELDYRVSKLFDHDAMKYTSDCKEYDSTQDASTQFLEDCFIEMYVPKSMVKIYREMRLCSKQKSSFLSMIKTAIKDSGESATLLMNTILKMFHTMLITEVRDVRNESFKGDDSQTNAGFIRICNNLLKLDPTLHLPIIADIDFPIHTDMAGWYYSSFGIIPDVLKLVTKFISRDFDANVGKQALSQWERIRYGCEELPYFDQVQLALRDKRKFLNFKKITYLRRIYRDLYNMNDENFSVLMTTFNYLCSSECNYRDFKLHNAIYWNEHQYLRVDLTEADRNRKKVKAIVGDIDSVKI